MENTANMISPELDAAALQAVDVNDQEAPAKKPVKILGVTMPEPIANVSRGFKGVTSRMRKATVKALPAFVVNNSSNILGAAHVGTEMLMFKSNMGEGQTLVQDPSNPINWIVQPIKTVFEGVAKGAMPKDLEYDKLFSRKGISYVTDRVGNLEGAATRERSRLEAVAKSQGKSFNPAEAKLANRWSMRSTFMGLVVWTLSAVIPEKKETPEEIEKMAIMRANHPIKYVGERLKEAVYFPEWNKHKRQMIGLGYVVIGICSMLGAWRGRTLNKEGAATYTYNASYFMTSLLSLISSVPLLFAIDEKSGYSGFGSIMMGRIPFLYGSIHQKYKNDKAKKGSIDGAHDYAVASVLFQAENMLQGLFGGAEKKKVTLPDGTVVEQIVDHNEVREEAAIKIKQAKIDKLKKSINADEQAVLDKVDLSAMLPKDVVTADQALTSSEGLVKEHKDVEPAVSEHTLAHPKPTQHAAEHEKPVHHDLADVEAAVSHEKPAHHAKIETHREQASEEAQKPVTHVTHERHVQHAMPERVAQHQQMAAAAAN